METAEETQQHVAALANVFHPSFAKIDENHYRKAFGHWANLIKSGVLPRDVKTPQIAMVLAEAGAVRGWSAFQALELLCMIQGTVAMRSKGMWTQILGFVREHSAEGLRVRPVERSIKRAAIEVARPDIYGAEPFVYEFTQEMGARAGLWGKPGPWSQYPEAMLWARVVGIVGRDAFGDVIHGLYTEEEVRDGYSQDAMVTQIGVGKALTTLDDLALRKEPDQPAQEVDGEEGSEDEEGDNDGEDDATR
jgi:hypothetical protein